MILKRLVPLWVVLLLFTFAITQSAVANTPLRVLSWNIQFGQGTDGITNYDRIASWLTRMNPDVITLCEVPPDNVPTLVNLLTQKTGRTWNSHFVPKAPGIAEGNLILSTYGFSAIGAYYLSYTRSVAQVTINVGGRSINIFATHLDHTSSSLRLTQAQELVNWTAGFAAPRIVAGDMNAGNDTPEVLTLLSAYSDSWVDALNLGSALAYPDNPVWLNTRTRRWRIDFILYAADASSLTTRGANIPDTRDLSNTNVVTLLGTTDDKGVRPSDHNLVVTDFDVLSAGPTPTPTPTPTPVVSSPPVILADTNNRAIALDSEAFTTGPFALTTPYNFSADKRTRMMLFGLNLGLLAGETFSAVTVRAVDSQGVAYALPVEFVDTVPGLSSLSVVIVRLPDTQPAPGDFAVNVMLRNATSNTVFISIK